MMKKSAVKEFLFVVYVTLTGYIICMYALRMLSYHVYGIYYMSVVMCTLLLSSGIY